MSEVMVGTLGGGALIVGIFLIVMTVTDGWSILRRSRNLRKLNNNGRWNHDHTRPIGFATAMPLMTPEDFKIDYNEVKFLINRPHFCGRHRFTLDAVHFHAGDPDRDDLMFSCKNAVTVAVDAPLGEPQEGEWACSATRTIERAVFWNGPAKIQEMYVDPEWLENYEANRYNENMRAFEKAVAFPGYIHIPEPKEPVFYNEDPVCGHTGPYGQLCNRKPNHEYGEDYKKGVKDQAHAYAGNYWDNEGNVMSA